MELLEKPYTRLEAEVVVAAVSVSGAVDQTYRSEEAQSVESLIATKAGTVYDLEVPSSANDWATVVGGVTVVIAVHTEAIVKDTVPAEPAIASPAGDVAVIAME